MLQQLTSHSSFDLPFIKYDGPAIVTIPLLLIFLVAFFASYIWLYHDARKRGKNGVIAILFIMLTGWPVSFIWWFWLRPSTKNISG